MTTFAPGAVIGILGGGQLGRMLATAAAELGFDVRIYTDELDSPASRVARETIVGSYQDFALLKEFASSVDVVTSEFENVPATTADAMRAAGVLVRPDPAALAMAQDRFEEKTFLNKLGVETAPFAAVTTRRELDAALDQLGIPAILKTRRLGYDGKGQARIMRKEDADIAFAAMMGQPAVLEAFCAFEREVSIVAARGADGAFAAYDLTENEHRNGILHRSAVPARCGADVGVRAQAMTHLVMQALDYVGVLTIEFFVMPDGRLLANEMASRVHNSGHWTMDACRTGQFEQHIRAVAGWPLGSPERLLDAEMINLIGEDAHQWRKLAADPDARVHLYGKREARAGRKMGHVTRLKARSSA